MSPIAGLFLTTAIRISRSEKLIWARLIPNRPFGTDRDKQHSTRTAFFAALFQRERLSLEGSVALLEQNLYFAFRAVQLLLALRGEAHALLEHLDRVFERQVTALQMGDDGLQLLQGFLKRCQRRPPPGVVQPLESLPRRG